MAVDNFSAFAKMVAASVPGAGQGNGRLRRRAAKTRSLEEYLAAFPHGSDPVFKKTHGARLPLLQALHPPRRQRRRGRPMAARCARSGTAPPRRPRSRTARSRRACATSSRRRASAISFAWATKEARFGAATSRVPGQGDGAGPHVAALPHGRDPEAACGRRRRDTGAGRLPDDGAGLRARTRRADAGGGGDGARRSWRPTTSTAARSTSRRSWSSRRCSARSSSQSEGRERGVFAWANAGNPAARFRNTVIGTLVQDLSEGQDVERAVHELRDEGRAAELQAHDRRHHARHGQEGDGDDRVARPGVRARAPVRRHRRRLGQRREVGRRHGQAPDEGRHRRRAHAARR